MPQNPVSAENFFRRAESWALSHTTGESYLVVFATENDLALAVLVYFENGVFTSKHFPKISIEDATNAAVTWTKRNIDPNVRLSKTGRETCQPKTGP